MKTIELLNPPLSLEVVLALATQESGVLLTKSGQPVAQVIPMPSEPEERNVSWTPGAREVSEDFAAARKRKLGLHPGAWVVSEDFDALLPDGFWLGKE